MRNNKTFDEIARTNAWKIPVDNIFKNIVGFAIAENSLLEEFRYAVWDINPLFSIIKSTKENKDFLLQKVEEIARYFKVSNDDVLAEELRLDKAQSIVRQYLEGTKKGVITWEYKKLDFITKDVNFVEKPSECIILHPQYDYIEYYYHGCYVMLIRMNIGHMYKTVHMNENNLGEYSILKNYISKFFRR